MTDRVQQMLDVVKVNFKTANKKYRGRKSAGVMRADVREGILKNPLGTRSREASGTGHGDSLAGYQGPRHPDLWRDVSGRATDFSSGHVSGPAGLEPAEAALAAFQNQARQSSKQSGRNGPADLSPDRPRMGGEPFRSIGLKRKPARNHSGSRRDSIHFDSPSALEGSGSRQSTRKKGWIKALFGR